MDYIRTSTTTTTAMPLLAGGSGNRRNGGRRLTASSSFSLVLLFFLVCSSADPAGAIYCFIGGSSDGSGDRLVDCSSLGLQREELYCRNVTMPDGGVDRSCVAMSWLDARSWEEIGCHTEQGITRCTCGDDRCNAPWQAQLSAIPSGGTKNSRAFQDLEVLILATFCGHVFHKKIN